MDNGGKYGYIARGNDGRGRRTEDTSQRISKERKIVEYMFEETEAWKPW